MIRILAILVSAIVAAGLFIVARAYLPELSGVSIAGTSLLAMPVPVIAAALAFPALYLVWEQSEL